jgi:hypothetical protein
MNGLIPTSSDWTSRQYFLEDNFNCDVEAGLVPAFFVDHVMIANEIDLLVVLGNVWISATINRDFIFVSRKNMIR